MPAGTVKVDVSDVYDWYKLGQHISNMKDLGQHDFGQGPPSAILSFGDEDLEHQYIQALKRTGLTTTDIDPVDPNQPPGMPRQKTDPTYNVDESSTVVRKNSCCLPCGLNFYRDNVVDESCTEVEGGSVTRVPIGNAAAVSSCTKGFEMKHCIKRTSAQSKLEVDDCFRDQPTLAYWKTCVPCSSIETTAG
jgi:hypothetical protein